MTMAEINEEVNEAYSWLRGLIPLCKRMSMLYYPFPEPWHKETARDSSDGFRYDKGGKNFIWATLLEKFLLDAQCNIRPEKPGDPYLNLLQFPTVGMSIEERARFVLDTYRKS